MECIFAYSVEQRHFRQLFTPGRATLINQGLFWGVDFCGQSYFGISWSRLRHDHGVISTNPKKVVLHGRVTQCVAVFVNKL